MGSRGCAFLLWLGLCLAPAVLRGGEPIRQASQEQLRRWLQQYPQADANRDGVLTVEEAEAYRRKIQQERAAGGKPAQPRFRHQFAMATMSDGVQIALAVGFPPGCDPEGGGRKWAAVFSTCGYTSMTVPRNPSELDDRYVTVNASVRGTGASGGALCPWEPRSWHDGYEIIENWIVKQPWSNGRVGIQGHSWSGLMGFLTATTNPPSLKAVCVSGLIDDFYRGICWIGGVRNCGFPVRWLNNYYRTDGPFGSDEAAQTARELDRASFATILRSRPARDLSRDMLWQLLHQPLDGPSWREQSPATHASRIRTPILIGHTWQDEQTGPTGWQLWDRVPDEVPKRLVLSNGHHGVRVLNDADVMAWFDHWLGGAPHADLANRGTRVRCYFETPETAEGRPSVRGTPLVASDFPLPETRWTRFFLRGSGRLAPSPPEAAEVPGTYQVTFGNAGGADERLCYLLAFDEPTAICGPAVLTLWAELTTLDTDFFVVLADLAPHGKMYGLQRGLLRASHRALDAARSRYVAADGQRLLVQPYHPHTRAEPVTPHEPHEFQIEIFAMGHVFRPGHKLALVITRPLEGDPIGVTRSGVPSYRYDSRPPAGTVRVLHDPRHPSNLLLPVLPQLPPLPPEPVPLEQQAGIQSAG